MPNDINSVSPSIRDYLLNRNLILADSIVNNGLSGSAIGLGGLSSLQELPEAVQASEDIEITSIEQRENLLLKNPYQSTSDVELVNISTTDFNNGNLKPGTPSEEYGNYIGSETEDSKFQKISNSSRELQTLKNRYISSEDMVSATVINNSFAYDQVDGGYLDENGHLNIGGPSTDTLDAIGSVISGKGFGLGSDGIDSQFDVRSSLAGRVLGGLGAINDTPLGLIGGEQLLLALGQKAIFNVQKETLGRLNLNPFSLLKGDGLISPNWSITTKSTTGGKIFDIATSIAGFESPTSKMDADSTIHFLGLTSKDNSSILKNTGKGQLINLFKLLNESNGDTVRYAPSYLLDADDNSSGVLEPKTYANSADELIDFSDPTFDFEISEANVWDSSPATPLDSDKSLIARTKRMFNDKPELYTGLFDKQGIIGPGNRLLNTPAHGRLSKGSGVVSQNAILGTDNDNVFCRTWTSEDTYSRVEDLQKNSGLYELGGHIRNNVKNSVLGSNGFVKISPYKLGSAENKRGDVKKFMFSIENLAWNDTKEQLPKQELGPGDLVSGKSGRIMWFPPYDMKFSDTSAVNWDTTKFIGRGEPIYTYNSTERSGTLSFQIIIDYPNYINNAKLKTDEVLASLAAGCSDYDEILSTFEATEIQNEINRRNKVGSIRANKQISPNPFGMFFPNDSATLIDGYEHNGGGGANKGGTSLLPITIGEGYTSEIGTEFPNNTDFGLNRRWAKDETDFIAKTKSALEFCPACDVLITGHASKAGNYESNQKLSEARAKEVHLWVLENLGDSTDVNFTKRIRVFSKGDTQSSGSGVVEAFATKKDRFVSVIFKYNPKNDPQVKATAAIESEPSPNSKELVTSIISRFHNEEEYFNELENSNVKSDKILYDNIRKQVDFFQPAFHSITPEGFNSRLTFLKQCTRQGPTLKSIGSQNLAFGAPPVCILRIGDFYHTKIVINNLGITYEPLVWDLNPEGVGVQPMIAKVDIQFKFIGGSSLNGPINKLQNAVSFNYFGNTEIYDPRADTIVATKDNDKVDKEFTIKDGAKKIEVAYFEYEEEFQGLDNKDREKNLKSTSDIESEKIVEPTKASDKTELSKINIVGHDFYFGNPDITFDFTYKHDKNSMYQLSKVYDGDIILRSNNDQVLNQVIGSIKARPNDETSFIVGSVVHGSNETIIDSNTTGEFSVTINYVSTESLARLEYELGSKSGTLALVWSTGTSNNINL